MHISHIASTLFALASVVAFPTPSDSNDPAQTGQQGQKTSTAHQEGHYESSPLDHMFKVYMQDGKVYEDPAATDYKQDFPQHTHSYYQYGDMTIDSDLVHGDSTTKQRLSAASLPWPGDSGDNAGQVNPPHEKAHAPQESVVGPEHRTSTSVTSATLSGPSAVDQPQHPLNHAPGVQASGLPQAIGEGGQSPTAGQLKAGSSIAQQAQTAPKSSAAEANLQRISTKLKLYDWYCWIIPMYIDLQELNADDCQDWVGWRPVPKKSHHTPFESTYTTRNKCHQRSSHKLSVANESTQDLRYLRNGKIRCYVWIGPLSLSGEEIGRLVGNTRPKGPKRRKRKSRHT